MIYGTCMFHTLEVGGYVMPTKEMRNANITLIDNIWTHVNLKKEKIMTFDWTHWKLS